MPICECGCDGVSARGAFLPGHDQKLRTELEHRVGGLAAMRSLVESAEAFAVGRLTADGLAAAVAVILRPAAAPPADSP